METNELDLNLDELDQIDANADRKLQVKNRFQQLANDKRDLSQQKEALEREKAEAIAKVQTLEKEREFLKNFNQVSSKFPEATQYQDKILERVNMGLDMEEATLGILAKEGKFTQAQPQPRVENPEGGSAVTNVSIGDKPLSDFTTNEKLAQLQELENSGELSRALRSGINVSG